MDTVVAAVPVVVPLLLITAGVMLISAVQTLCIGLLGGEKKLYFPFSTMAAAVAIYQLSYAYSLSSNGIADALLGLKWQAAAITVFFPAAFLFMATYSRQKAVGFWFALVLISSAALFVINLLSPYSLRYESVQPLQLYFTSSGELLHLVRGRQSLSGYLMHAYGLVILLWLFYRCIALFKQGKKRAAELFCLYLIMQLAAAIYGSMIDKGIVEGFYVAGYSFTALVLLMTTGAPLLICCRSWSLRVASQEVTLSTTPDPTDA